MAKLNRNEFSNSLLKQLHSHLASSNAEQRKHWANRIIEEAIPFDSLISLFHSESKTAQRFMWLVGDIVRVKPDIVAPSMPLLFSLRDQMPFPGMDRSLAVWLYRTKVPEVVCPDAIDQLFDWLGNKTAAIAAKSFAAKALMELVEQKRASREQFRKALRTQVPNKNRAFEKRMQKILDSL